MHWVDEGTNLALPIRVDAVEFPRVERFGNWLRLAGEVAPGAACTVVATLHQARCGALYSSRFTVSGEKAGRQTATYSAPSSPGVL